MDYNYEALDDKRFQKLCQALIVAQFPDAQCLPVGEPDGGRDAILLHGYSNNKKTVVFQVKFSRNPDQKSSDRNQQSRSEGTNQREATNLGWSDLVLFHHKCQGHCLSRQWVD